MVDLHMHTTYSDGDKSVEEILNMCEERKLEYISITDYNTCKQYNDKAMKENNFTGKIITGTEQNAVSQGRNVEILGYNVDTDVMNEWCQKYYLEEKLREQQTIFYKRLLDICDKHGLKYDETKIEKPKKANQFIEPLIYAELMRHKENYEILGEFTKSMIIFCRKGLSNPNSSYFINYIEFRPSSQEVVDIIHQAGGKAFLAHPFEYKFENTIEFIDNLRKETKLDGIECFHPSSADDNKKDILVEYARKNNLYFSGGSDYHGKPKPDIEIGIGRGNLNISKDLIKEWI